MSYPQEYKPSPPTPLNVGHPRIMYDITKAKNTHIYSFHLEFKPAIFDQCAMVQGCAMDGPQVCHVSLVRISKTIGVVVVFFFFEPLPTAWCQW